MAHDIEVNLPSPTNNQNSALASQGIEQIVIKKHKQELRGSDSHVFRFIEQAEPKQQANVQSNPVLPQLVS